MWRFGRDRQPSPHSPRTISGAVDLPQTEPSDPYIQPSQHDRYHASEQDYDEDDSPDHSYRRFRMFEIVERLIHAPPSGEGRFRRDTRRYSPDDDYSRPRSRWTQGLSIPRRSPPPPPRFPERRIPRNEAGNDLEEPPSPPPIQIDDYSRPRSRWAQGLAMPRRSPPPPPPPGRFPERRMPRNPRPRSPPPPPGRFPERRMSRNEAGNNLEEPSSPPPVQMGARNSNGLADDYSMLRSRWVRALAMARQPPPPPPPPPPPRFSERRMPSNEEAGNDEMGTRTCHGLGADYSRPRSRWVRALAMARRPPPPPPPPPRFRERQMPRNETGNDREESSLRPLDRDGEFRDMDIEIDNNDITNRKGGVHIVTGLQADRDFKARIHGNRINLGSR